MKGGNRGGAHKDSDENFFTEQATRWLLATGVLVWTASQMNSRRMRVTKSEPVTSNEWEPTASLSESTLSSENANYKLAW